LKWRDVASVKIKFKVPATQHHRRKHPAPNHWRAISNVRFLFGLTTYRRNWLLHLQIIPQNRIPLKSYHYRPQGRKTIGRPKKIWREQL